MQQPHNTPGTAVVYVDFNGEAHNALITEVWTDAEIISPKSMPGISLAYIPAESELTVVARVPHVSKYGEDPAGQTFYWDRPVRGAGEVLNDVIQRCGPALGNQLLGRVPICAKHPDATTRVLTDGTCECVECVPATATEIAPATPPATPPRARKISKRKHRRAR